MALDLRGSERLSNFRWRCLECGTSSSVYGSFCRACNWPGDDETLRRVDIEVHRAKRTHYPHTTVLLNVPQRRLDNLLRTPGWELLVAAKFLGLPETAQTPLEELGNATRPGEGDAGGLSGADLDALLGEGGRSGASAQQVLERLQALREERAAQREAASAGAIGGRIVNASGVPEDVWRGTGYELLEALMPLELGRPVSVDASGEAAVEVQLRRLGMRRLTLVADYPIVTAAFGFSRTDYRPNRCRLNVFGQMREHGGRYPIFVDEVQADALIVQLDPERIYRWLIANGLNPALPAGQVQEIARRGHFIELFRGASFYQTIQGEAAEVRMTFGLMHSLAHLSVRQAGLLCGLDATSLSEYLIPSTLTFGIYCNHRFGATIGALSALFEQSLPEWLGRVEGADQCVYDPVCRDVGGSCHSCLHLAETSCGYFNLNLSRAFLFGGGDTVLGQVAVGYFDRALD